MKRHHIGYGYAIVDHELAQDDPSYVATLAAVNVVYPDYEVARGELLKELGDLIGPDDDDEVKNAAFATQVFNREAKEDKDDEGQVVWEGMEDSVWFKIFPVYLETNEKEN